jgi:hypothetical protein
VIARLGELGKKSFGGPAPARPGRGVSKRACKGRARASSPAAARPRQALPERDVVPYAAQGYLSPLLAPWGAERLFAEGRIVLPGATGAAGSVATAAAAAAKAEGLSVASSAREATLASFRVPEEMVGVVTGYYARPSSLLGYDAGHVTFALDRGGQRTQLPQRLLGLRGDFNHLIPIHYVVKPTVTVSLLASNGSTLTWHEAEGAFELFLVPRDLFRRFVDPSV